MLSPPRHSPRSRVDVDGKRRTTLVADEMVGLVGYDATPVRQLSAYEDATDIQILTPNTGLARARLLPRLGGR